ncbi:MAG: transcription-repair coupling factor [Planctomycetota bacterium]|nr:MAG: transcription-repair coupling factor [Planctomycetota bacterium]
MSKAQRGRKRRGKAIWSPIELRQRFALSDAYAQVPLWPEPGAPAALSGLSGSAKSLCVAALREESDSVIVVLCSDEIECDEWREDLRLWSPESVVRPAPSLLPELEVDELQVPEMASLASRRTILQGLDRHGLLLMDMSALMAPVAPPSQGRVRRFRIAVGEEHEPRKLFEELHSSGLRHMPQVLRPGEISQRGDVLDLWPLGESKPLRIEFFDEEVESLRRFDPEAQCSIETLPQVVIAIGEANKAAAQEELCYPLDLLDPKQSILVVIEPVRFEEQLSRFTLRSGTVSAPVAAFQQRLKSFRAFSLSTLPQPNSIPLNCSPPPATPVESGELSGRIFALTRGSDRPLVVLRSEAEAQRLLRIAKESSGGRDTPLDVCVGSLARGFRVPELDVLVLGHGEFFGTGVARRRSVQGKPRHRIASRAIDSFFELSVGDLVVHAVHGVAMFVGVERTTRSSQDAEEDHLRLAFAGNTEVLVPVSKIDLVQKYVGAGGHTQPKLDKIGSKAFGRRKAQVAQALRDMAADLLQIQIDRAQSRAQSFPADDPIISEFIDSFPYEDTEDQAKASEEIRRDLANEQPMDRLLCGDVGFGKTELAMRAAVQVAAAGSQVCVLVPTTLLAEQHGRTFRDRMASFPIRVEVLSRLQTNKTKAEIIEGLGKGSIDILIGTHALLSKKVRFQDLGLLIVDEEQRFGVAHKEKIKQMRANVDVLTMTATPIPRTLHMSLLGIKDISSLASPPPGRLEITTKVVERSRQILRQAILHELQRGGQVFFLHNRVQTLERVRTELEDLVPEARITTGHGQMSEKELLKHMQSFLSGAADVLLATTIIGSGIDIPRANTILVDRADMFGLADLHQLRGRVGRDITHAHCYLLIDPAIPMKAQAKQRLQAMERFSGLGSGFSIAMRDLEIRGAGNLLGPEQSGHIAAIGYDMYCKLLQAAVARSSDPEQPLAELPEFTVSRQVDVDLGVDAYIPSGYIDDEALRLGLLREFDEAVDAKAYNRILASLQDRFGRLPRPARNLLDIFLVKHQLASRSMTGARFMPPDRLILSHDPGRGPQGRWLELFNDVRPVKPSKTHLMIPEKACSPERVLELLFAALLGEQAPSTLGPSKKRRRRRNGRKR